MVQQIPEITVPNEPSSNGTLHNIRKQFYETVERLHHITLGQACEMFLNNKLSDDDLLEIVTSSTKITRTSAAEFKRID